jgi:hypothetical protein
MTHKMMALGFCLALAAGLFGAMPAQRAAAATCTSNGTGNWSATGTWSGCGSGIPQTGDDVVIASGHTVTVDTDTASINSVTVDGTLRFDNSGTGKSITVTGDVAVNSGGVLDVATGGSNTTHTMTIGGNLAVNGAFNAVPATNRVIGVTFNKAGDQTVTGSGTITFKKVTLNKGSAANKVVASSNVTVGSGADDFDPNNGAWEQANGILTKSGGTVDIGANGGLLVSGSGSLSFGGALSLINAGVLTVDTSGSVTLGEGNNRLETLSDGTTSFESGTVNIDGRLALTSGSTTFSGAAVTIDPQTAQTTAATQNVFFAAGAAAVTLTGGSITVVDPIAAPGSGREMLITSGSGSKSFGGGTIYIGDGSSSTAGSTDGFEIDTGGVTLFSFVVNNQQGSDNRYTTLINNPLNLDGSLTIQSGGDLRAGSQNITLKGNWANSGAFNAGAGTVTFNGMAGNQTISGSTATAFNNLTVNGIGGSAGTNSVVVIPTSNTPTVAGTLTNNGVLKQTRDASSSAEFLRITNGSGTDKYRGVDLAPSTGSGATSVKVHGNQNTSGALGFPVNRWYQIDPTNAGTANLTFHFLCSELQTGQTPANLKVWRYNGSTWENLGNSSNSGSTCSGTGFLTVNAVDLSADERTYVLKINDPTAVTLAEFYAEQMGDYVRVTWETASELDNVGFNLWRGVSPDGPDTKLNDLLIPSQSLGNPGGFTYTWDDDADLVPGTTYYYWVEDVDVNNVATRHGPVSVDFVVPTAVTLSGLQASPAAGMALPWLWVVAVAGAALGAGRLRRRG